MRLTYYAVEVGEAKETDFSIENELNVENMSDRPSIQTLMNDEDSTLNLSENILKIHDVILAGVEVMNT